MKLRGPDSSGNAELAVRSSQQSRKKGGAAVAIATPQRSLWELRKRHTKMAMSCCSMRQSSETNEHAERHGLSHPDV